MEDNIIGVPVKKYAVPALENNNCPKNGIMELWA
jgi:hypothetical protein